MKKTNTLWLTILLLTFNNCLIYGASTQEKQLVDYYRSTMEEPGALVFNPPQSWSVADPATMPGSVKIMVIGSGLSDYPPSINMGSEAFKGTLRDYLKIVRDINSSQGATWKDLGKIKTEAGEASLSQVDTQTEWGTVRLMHAIRVEKGKVYILTAAARKDEFPKYSDTFLTAFRSLRRNPDVFEMISDRRQKAKVKSEWNRLQKDWKTMISLNPNQSPESLFNSERFQNDTWKPFIETVNHQTNEQGLNWHQHFFEYAKSNLLTIK